MSGGFFVPAPPIPPIGPLPLPFTEVPTVFLALGLLGFELVQGATIIACANHNVVVDHVLQNENGLRVGVKQLADGQLQIVLDEEEVRAKEGIEANELKKRFQQKLSYARVVERLKAEGYQVVEETEEANETIRLVVRRWR